MISEEAGLTLWFEALQSDWGIAIETDHKVNLINRLFDIRNKYPHETELWELKIKYNEDWIPDNVVLIMPVKPTKVPPAKPMTDQDLDTL